MSDCAYAALRDPRGIWLCGWRSATALTPSISKSVQQSATFVSLPEEVFQPYTHAKTCVLFLEKKAPAADETIEMAIADWCGHDSRGNPTLRIAPSGPELLDDIPNIAEQMHAKAIWS